MSSAYRLLPTAHWNKLPYFLLLLSNQNLFDLSKLKIPLSMRKTLLFLTGLIILSANTIGQDIPVWKKMHYLSKEEMELPHENAKNFVPTDPPEAPVRMVAEYENMQSVLVRYPFGLPVSLMAEMSQDCGVTTIVANSSQQASVNAQYMGAGANMNNIDYIIAPSDSYWTRDYGPWFVIDGNEEFGVCDFPYNRPRPNDNNIPSKVADHLNINLFGMPLDHTGGNWMCSGLTQAASTDLVWEENPSLSQTEIEEMVYDYLGVSAYHVLPDPLDEYIKHIDCWGKYLGMNKVLIGAVLPSDPRYDDFEYVADYFASTISDWGKPYEVYRVFTPGDYPNTPYTNSLILNKKVFVPITGSPHDAQALEVYEEAMPGYEIIGVLYNSWENTDALHCRAKGIADTGMLKIRHTPLSGVIQQQDQYTISASITAYSGSEIYPDSALLYYKVNGGAYQPVQMTNQIGYSYTGTIPYQEEGSLINYYIYAADASGRSASHPYIGAPDPHEFSVLNMIPGLEVEPDTLLFVDVAQAVEGLSVKIMPEGDEESRIDGINQEGWDGFHWYAEPELSFPYDLAAGDSVILTVYVSFPVDQTQGMLQDTMLIECEGGDREVLIMVDEDLVSGIEEPRASVRINLAYPNPFENSTNFEISVDRRQQLVVEVFDHSGKHIRTIASKSFPAGNHRLEWDAEGQPAGIYYVRMRGETDITTTKVIRR